MVTRFVSNEKNWVQFPIGPRADSLSGKIPARHAENLDSSSNRRTRFKLVICN